MDKRAESISYIGWLSPSGEFFRCGYSDHEAEAYRLVKEPKQELSCSDELLAHGWVKLTISLLGNKEQRILYLDRITALQKPFLREILDKCEIRINEYEKDMLEQDLEE